MTCVHKVRWSVKRPEDCRFRLSVSRYKDRIVAPDEYSGATVVTPSDQTQILPTKDKTVRANITVNPAPTETLSTTSNGTFTPSDGHVGFSQVNVDVQPDLRPLSVSENGQYSSDGFDGYSQVSVDVHNHGYSDDINDFSGGNILALIGHAQEYIVTEYYPKLCTDYYLKLTKPTFYRNYEGFFSALFVNENARPGIQMANRSDRVNILVTRYIVAQNVALPLPTTDPTVWSTRCAMSGGALQTASKPLVIFHGYGASNLDVIGGFNFYGLKCYEFGKLVKKYVPWLDENNVPCVHELVDDEYFYNVGTGAFGYIDLEGNTHDT